jgi:hypothetical protein
MFMFAVLQVDPNQQESCFTTEKQLDPTQPRPPFIDRIAYLFWVAEDRSNVLKLRSYAAADNVNLQEKKAAKQSTTAVLLGMRSCLDDAKLEVRNLLAKLPSEEWPPGWTPVKELPLDCKKYFADDSIPAKVGKDKKTYTIGQLVKWRATVNIEDFDLRVQIVVRMSTHLIDLVGLGGWMGCWGWCGWVGSHKITHT